MAHPVKKHGESYTKKLHLLSSSNEQEFVLPNIIRTGIHRCEGTGVRNTEMTAQYRTRIRSGYAGCGQVAAYNIKGEARTAGNKQC